MRLLKRLSIVLAIVGTLSMPTGSASARDFFEWEDLPDPIACLLKYVDPDHCKII